MYDTATPGLLLSITGTGSKAFYWYGRVKGQVKPIRYHLGDAGSGKITGKISVDEAQREAKRVSADAAQGIDPRAKRVATKAKAIKDAATAETIGQLWKRFEEKHLRIKCRPSTAHNDVSRYSLHLSPWAGRSVADVTKEDVTAMHDRITTTLTPATADKVLQLLQRLLTWGKLDPNPVTLAVADETITFRNPEDSKISRFLTKEELGRLLKTLDETSNTTIADAIRFALLSGARKSNITGAKWMDLHLEQGLWIIPRSQSKSGKAMTVALTIEAVTLLRERRKMVDIWLNRRQRRYKLAEVESCDFVFPGQNPAVPLRDLNSTWRRVRKAAGIADVRFHDLRHSLASWMALGGASMIQIGRQLGHSDQQSTARYVHLQVEAVRPATQAATSAMFATGKPTK